MMSQKNKKTFPIIETFVQIFIFKIEAEKN